MRLRVTHIVNTVTVLFVIAAPARGLAQANWQPSPFNLIPESVAPDDLGGIERGVAEGTDEGSVSNPAPAGVSLTSDIVARQVIGLPPPANPNLLFGNTDNPTVGSAVRVPLFGIEGGLPMVYGNATVGAQAAFGFDTGYVGSGVRLFPSTVAIDGTDESRRRGSTILSAEATQLNVTLAPAIESSYSARADFQLDFFDGVQLRLAKGQLALGNGLLYGGKTWSTFMDEYAVPLSISADTTAAGAVFRRLAQLGLAFPIAGSENARGFIALEEPSSTDFTLPISSDQRITRYPTLVTRLQWANSRDWQCNSTVHLAAMVRGFGREDIAFREDFGAGWGLSLMTKLRPWSSHCHTVYAGAVTGEGVGDYLFGFAHHNSSVPDNNRPAAVPVNDYLQAQRNYGAYLGYTRTWSSDSQSNVGYGYAFADTTPEMPADATRMLQNCWINHQVKLNELVAIGLEYHYTYRDVQDLTDGDNHRVLTVLQFLSK